MVFLVKIDTLYIGRALTDEQRLYRLDVLLNLLGGVVF